MKDKVLLIDDSSEVKILIESAIGQDFEIVYCQNGQEVLQAIENQKFEIILLDLMLPDISGFELSTILKAHENTKNAFVCIVSAKRDLSSKVTAYNLGAINYIEKPFEIKLVNGLVKSLLANIHHKPGHQIEIDNVSVNVLNQEILIAETPIKTTSSEFKIFCYLLERQGQTVPRETLLNIIKTVDSNPSDRIIDTHISSLRKKIKSEHVEIKAKYKEGYGLYFS